MRRVLSLCFCVSLDFLREKAGITYQELAGVSELAPVQLAFEMAIEEWATHTVRHIYSRKQEVIYGRYWDDNPVWTHFLPQTEDRGLPTRLEVALSGGSVHLWARGGRFSPWWADEPRDEYVFLTIPLARQAGLEKYYIDPNATDIEEDLKPQIEGISGSDRYYRHEETHIRWTLTVHDFAAGARESLRARLSEPSGVPE